MAEFQPLAGKICLVTGATRGIGRGIALQLGQAGATVYITGRTLTGTTSLEATSKEIESRGGKCIPVQCDHSNTDEVKKLFEQIKREQDGQLDVLVNNAYSAVKLLTECVGNNVKYWEKEPSVWDEVNNVGLRNHYYCTVYATRMMIDRKQGLIVNVSSAGGLIYLFNVAYGVGKQALDRMSADCAQELKKHNIACVSLWPGSVQTENIMEALSSDLYKNNPMDKYIVKAFENGESTEYSGKAVVHLAKDPKIMRKSGRILMTAELGDEYGFVDINGCPAKSLRSISDMLASIGYNKIAAFIPRFIKIPYWVLTLFGGKF